MRRQAGALGSYDLAMNARKSSAGKNPEGTPWRPRVPVPPKLASKAFAVADARAAGFGRGSLSNAGLERPFHGVRQVPPPAPRTPRPGDKRAQSELDEFQKIRIRQRRRIRAYLPRLRPGQAFGPRSTALILGLPLPARMVRDTTVDVIVPQGACRPKAAGVVVRGVPTRHYGVLQVNGLPCTPPELLYCLLARELNEVDLLALGDALVTDSDIYPNRTWFTALSSEEALGKAVVRWAPGTAVARLRRITPMIRLKVESPYETAMRFHLHESGYPELTVQHPILVDGFEAARGDAADLQARILYNFDGDGHRVDRRQWQADVKRPRLLVMLGWHAERLTLSDLEPSPDAFVRYAHQLRRQRLQDLEHRIHRQQE